MRNFLQKTREVMNSYEHGAITRAAATESFLTLGYTPKEAEALLYIILDPDGSTQH